MSGDSRSDSTDDAEEKQVVEILYDKWGNLQSVELSFFDRLVQSMRGFGFYRIVLIEEGKQAFYYLLKLCLLVGLVSGLAFGYTIYETAGDVSESLQAQMPETTIKNGEVSVAEQTPYRMTLENDYEVILDPEAKLNRLRLDSNVLVVLVKSSLYIRNGPDSFESWPLSTFIGDPDDKTITLTGETIAEWTPFMKRSLFLMSILVMIVFVTIQTGFWALIISIGGLIASESGSPLFGWTTFVTLSCYAVTPIVLAQALFFVTGINVQFQRYLLLGGGSLYVYFIVKYLEQNLTDVTFESSDEGSVS